MDKEIDWKLLGEGRIEDLKLRIKKLEETAKIGFIREFIGALIEYDRSYREVRNYLSPKDLESSNDKVKEIFNYISSRETDRYWNY